MLYKDASKIAVGAVLLQLDSNGIEPAVSVFSNKLSSAQRNYSTFKRECLAVMCALEHFRVYLLGRRFHFRINHRTLAWLFSKEPKASARISGWLATLMEYPIEIEYVRGDENTIADALSISTPSQSTTKYQQNSREESRHSLAPIAWTREPIGYLSNNPMVQSRMLSVS